MSRLLPLLLGLVMLCGPAAAQTSILSLAKASTAPASPATPALTQDQITALITALQNPQSRAALIGSLRTLGPAHAAPPASAPPAASLKLAPGSVGAELLSSLARAMQQGSAAFMASVRTLAQVHLFRLWLIDVRQDPATRALLLALLGRLAVIGGLGIGAQYAVWRLLRPAREKLNHAAPADEPRAPAAPTGPARPSRSALLRRLPLVLLRLVLDAVPLSAFATLLYGLLATPFGAVADARVVLLGLGNAYLLVGLGLIVAHALLSPETPRLRLLGVSDAAARYMTRWSLRLLSVGLFGYMLSQISLLLGMFAPLHQALLHVIGLILHGMVLVIILQKRQAVARRLRAPRGATGVMAMLRNGLAGSWHIIAIFYNFAIWMIFAFEVHGGFLVVWRDFLIGLAVFAIARLLAIVLHGAIDRPITLNARMTARFPDLPGRAARYRPLLHALVSVMLVCIGGAVLLQAWHVPVLALLGNGKLGGRVARALLRSAVVAMLAILVWEFANAALSGRLARLERETQAARAARLRTLLPLLRTTMLVVVLIFAALTILNQIGINTAPLLAGAGVVGIAIGFGSQKLVQDVITGLFLLLENAMQVGDWVTAASLSGTVETLSIRTLRLRGSDGSIHVVPFSSVTTITNSTRDFGYAMLHVSAGYNEEPDKITSIVRAVVADMKQDETWAPIMPGELEVWGVDRFDLYAWVLLCRIRTLASQQSGVQREFNRRMKYRFDALGIESPMTAPRALHPPPSPIPPEMPA